MGLVIDDEDGVQHERLAWVRWVHAAQSIFLQPRWQIQSLGATRDPAAFWFASTLRRSFPQRTPECPIPPYPPLPALTARNSAGHTRIHIAAKNGELGSLPREALTAKYLTIRNDAGYTPLHHAAIGGHLDQVPAEVLTTENLSIRSNAGFTVFHTAAAHGQPGADPGRT
jgi:ankyrin repeat protein